MTPSSFTKGEVALLDPSLSLSRGSAGEMQGMSCAQGMWREKRRDKFRGKRERLVQWWRMTDRGKVRQCQIEPERTVGIKKTRKRREQNETVRFGFNISKMTLKTRWRAGLECGWQMTRHCIWLMGYKTKTCHRCHRTTFIFRKKWPCFKIESAYILF